MKNQTLITQLNKIAKTDDSWKKDVIFYEENKEWLDLSANIAIRVLGTLRANKLAEKYSNSQKKSCRIDGY